MAKENRIYWPIEKLKNWDKNPRAIDKKDLARLKHQIQTLGDYKPLIITPEGEVIGGNMRLTAHRELGTKEVWVSIVTPKNEAQKIEYALSDNDRAGFYQGDQLAELISGVKTDLDMANYCVDLGEMTSLVDLLSAYGPPPEDDADSVPKLGVKPKSKMGDIYSLGKHRLMCGDATRAEDINKLMAGTKASMVFTDPPYNVDYTGGMGTHAQNKRSGILNDRMTKERFLAFLKGACASMIKNCTGGIYICMSSSELDTLKTAFEEEGGHWQSFVIWVKDNFTLSRADYQHTYEPILYGWPKKVVNHFFVDDRAKANVWEDLSKVKVETEGDFTVISFQGFKVKIKGRVEAGEVLRKRQRTDIWRFNKPTRSEEHPTMKPVALVQEAIINSSKIGQIVLDIFGGSGSTMIAAERLDRKCYMMELDPLYVDVIIKRWENFTGKKAVKEKA